VAVEAVLGGCHVNVSHDSVGVWLVESVCYVYVVYTVQREK
jgi:hypothetical protein